MVKITMLLLAIFTIAYFYSSNPVQSTSSTTQMEEGDSVEGDSSSCVSFDSEERIVTITCEAANLSDINDQLMDQDVLRRDETVDKGWILNAGIQVCPNTTLYINFTDTSWLKILADEQIDYPILVSGSLKIDSVKVTSWNPNTNNYTTSQDSDRNGDDVTIGTPRPYIVVEDGATGTTDITNSEIAFLGYESGYGGGRTGLRYEAGDGSIIRGNEIHNL